MMIDKTILVFYICVAPDVNWSVPYGELQQILTKVREDSVRDPEDEKKMIKYFIPVKGEQSRIECLNPGGLYDKKLYEELMEKLKNTNDRLDKISNSLSPLTREVLTEKM
jgi:hypothetical protein